MISKCLTDHPRDFQILITLLSDVAVFARVQITFAHRSGAVYTHESTCRISGAPLSAVETRQDLLVRGRSSGMRLWTPAHGLVLLLQPVRASSLLTLLQQVQRCYNSEEASCGRPRRDCLGAGCLYQYLQNVRGQRHG